MNIGALAEKVGIPPKTIRYYEDKRLIRKADRQPNGYRAYSERHMRELSFIKRARGLGFSVEEVGRLLALWRDKGRKSAAVKALAARHLDALDRRIAELQSVRRSLAHLMQHCRGDERPDCPILDGIEDGGRGAGGLARADPGSGVERGSRNIEPGRVFGTMGRRTT